MGEALDNLCKLAGQNTCAHGLNPGDWYYSTDNPNVIRCVPDPVDPVIESIPCNEDDTYVNEASGLSYKFNSTHGMIPKTFVQSDQAYIIWGQIENVKRILEGEVEQYITIGIFEIPDNCTLIFRGGTLNGKFEGNNTTIDAPAIRIFGDNIELNGTFTDYAYPEWWGAKTTSVFPESVANLECSTFIQKALDSPFPEIRFSAGYYYLDDSSQNQSLLSLRYCKRLTLRGETRYAHDSYTNTKMMTVLWTDQDKDVLEICIKGNTNTSINSNVNSKFVITGGEINVSRCPIFRHSVVMIHPTSIQDCTLTTALVGPMPKPLGGQVSVPNAYQVNIIENSVNWSSNNDFIIPAQGLINGIEITQNNLVTHLDELLNHYYMGVGLRIKDRGRYETSETGRGFLYVFVCKSSITGFGHGILIDYNKKYSVVTASEFDCTINRCFRYVYSPSSAFAGGVFSGRIQTSRINSRINYAGPIIYGNFTNAFINPFVWDVPTGVNMYKFTDDTTNVRFGQRVLSATMPNNHSAFMQEERRVEEVEGTTVYSGWHDGARTLATILEGDHSAFLGGLGNYDMQALPAENIRMRAANYVHLLDNDLLAFDLIYPDIMLLINGCSQCDFKTYYGKDSSDESLDLSTYEKRKKYALVNDLFQWFDVVSWSAFDREGFKIHFNEIAQEDFRNYHSPIFDNNGDIIGHEAGLEGENGGDLTIDIVFPTQSSWAIPYYYRMNLLALHLKGNTFSYYRNLRFTYTTRVGTYELYDGSYVDISMSNKLADLVLPFLFNTTDIKDLHPLGMRLEFTCLEKNVESWSHESSFGFVIEGRANRHYHHNIFTSNGGSLGGDILRLGKPYLLGSKKFSSMAELPVNAAEGAIGVLNYYNNTDPGDIIDNDYPVIKTPKEWMVQSLTGTTYELNSLASYFGGFSIGQSAFSTTLGKPVWWNGMTWVDASGTAV